MLSSPVSFRLARQPLLWWLNRNVSYTTARIHFFVPIFSTLVVALLANAHHCRGAWKCRHNCCRLSRCTKSVTGNANSSSDPHGISISRTVIPVPILLTRIILSILLVLARRILPILLVLTRRTLPILLVLTRRTLPILLITASSLLVLVLRTLPALLVAASSLLVLVLRTLPALLVAASSLLVLILRTLSALLVAARASLAAAPLGLGASVSLSSL